MDNRLRFLYQLTAFDDGGTQEAKQTSRLEEWGQAVSQDVSQMLTSGLTSCDGERNYSSEVADVTLPRKASKEHVNCPYRKPTQVGEERILR